MSLVREGDSPVNRVLHYVNAELDPGVRDLHWVVTNINMFVTLRARNVG